jgi:hypothetical protein
MLLAHHSASRHTEMLAQVVKPNTEKSYRDSLKPLNAFFSEKPINEIEIIHLRMYQDLRSGKLSAHSVTLCDHCA